MRGATNGIYPNVVVWENVPGAYSSHKGEDFRRVLEELAKVADPNVSVPRPAGGTWDSDGCVMGDGFSIAWRTLDAQFWGVPQRRKRIFLVADFRGGRAPEILFKRGGLSRDFAESRKARKGPAAYTERNTDISGREFTPKTLKIRCGREGGGKGALIQENKSATLSCNNDQILFAPAFKGGAGAKAESIGYFEKVSPTLQAGQDTHCLHVCCDGNGTNAGTVTPTLTTASGRNSNKMCTVFCLDRAAFNQGKNAKYDFSVQENMAQTIVARGSGAVANIGRMVVRRLMPVEEARLQGFPDWWCADVPHKDAPEYRMWGNGVALPCVLYVMEGIAECLN